MLRLYCLVKSYMDDLRDRMVDEESGQTMVEYVLMVVLIALVVALAVPNVTSAISSAFGKIAGQLGE